MLAYLDSSIVLRVVFGETDRSRQLRDIEYAISSALLQVECLRTIDRMRLRVPLADKEVARRREAVFEFIRRTEIIQLTSKVLERATEPFPTVLGTLDAIHLASALLWRDSENRHPVFMTHDAELGLAARAMGFEVLGTAT